MKHFDTIKSGVVAALQTSCWLCLKQKQRFLKDVFSSYHSASSHFAPYSAHCIEVCFFSLLIPSVLLPVKTSQRCAIDFGVQSAPDKMPPAREMIRRGDSQQERQQEEGKRGKRKWLNGSGENSQAKQDRGGVFRKWACQLQLINRLSDSKVEKVVWMHYPFSFICSSFWPPRAKVCWLAGVSAGLIWSAAVK